MRVSFGNEKQRDLPLKKNLIKTARKNYFFNYNDIPREILESQISKKKYFIKKFQ